MANDENLKNHILSLSVSDTYSSAKKEWKLTNIVFDENGTNCPCGQPIKEICYIRNSVNSNETFVGNVCIKRFMDIDTGKAFKGLKRIIEDDEARPNEDLIKWALELKYIHQNEYDFLMGIRRKRKISEKQLNWLKKINWRIKNRKKIK